MWGGKNLPPSRGPLSRGNPPALRIRSFPSSFGNYRANGGAPATGRWNVDGVGSWKRTRPESSDFAILRGPPARPQAVETPDRRRVGRDDSMTYACRSAPGLIISSGTRRWRHIPSRSPGGRRAWKSGGGSGRGANRPGRSPSPPSTDPSWRGRSIRLPCDPGVSRR